MKTKTAPGAFLRTSFTETVLFTTRPDAATRRALREAGFRWNGMQWFRNQNQTAPIKPADLLALIAPAEQPSAATA